MGSAFADDIPCFRHIIDPASCEATTAPAPDLHKPLGSSGSSPKMSKVAGQNGRPAQIDHIIILLTPEDFTNVPSWLTKNFTILDGGVHSKGTSQNKLIVFKDGSYLELFSWTNPQPDGVPPHADFPSWADKPEGCIIDWALTGKDAYGQHKQLMTGLEKLRAKGETVGITYDEPKEGGRQRKDGENLKWVTTRPRRTTQEALTVDVPFFCHDLTPRVLRVPNHPGAISSMPDLTTHPCGATGVAGIVIEVSRANIEKSTLLYEAVLGHIPPAVRKEGASIFYVDAPDPITEDTISRQCSIHLQEPDDDHRFSKSRPDTSIRRLVLYTDIDERKGEQLDQGGFGTPINLC